MKTFGLANKDDSDDLASASLFATTRLTDRVALPSSTLATPELDCLEADLALSATRRAQASRPEASEVIGERQGLRQVMDLVHCIAATDVPVLITGETGVGKEVVARALHMRSQRASGPMIKVNCGAIPPELIDSELFGHERGSFTGAVGVRKGWFERADGGTLFLDEIGELPLDAQVRLLRVLQDGTFERVGGQRPLHTDVRIVAATHRDLCTMTSDGTFRRDLWYRISVFPLRIPPLRERPADIGTLARHFSKIAGERLAGHPLEPNADDLTALTRYPWPGNVRELAAVVERAAILGGGGKLEISLAMSLLGFGPQPAPAEEAPTRREGPLATGSIAPLQTIIIEHVERALRASGGQIEGPRGAAAMLGINPHTLRARMRKLGIDWSRFRRHEAS